MTFTRRNTGWIFFFIGFILHMIWYTQSAFDWAGGYGLSGHDFKIAFISLSGLTLLIFAGLGHKWAKMHGMDKFGLDHSKYIGNIANHIMTLVCGSGAAIIFCATFTSV